MRSLISIIILSLIVPFTLADYSITKPGTGVVWHKGKTETVEWTIISHTDTTVDVKLLRGQAANLQYVATLCTKVDPAVGRCSYVVPGNLTSDRDYAVTVGDDVNHLGYSSFFSIESSGNLPKQKGCPNFGGQNCPSTLPCCSYAGYCGDTDEHCGQGCMPQYSFNGLCVKSNGAPPPEKAASASKPPPSKTSPTGKTTPKKKTTPTKKSTRKSRPKKTTTRKPSPKKTATGEHCPC